MIFNIGRHIVFINKYYLPTIFWYSLCKDKFVKELINEYDYRYYHQWETINGETRITTNILSFDKDKKFEDYIEEAMQMIVTLRNN